MLTQLQRKLTSKALDFMGSPFGYCEQRLNLIKSVGSTPLP